MELRVKNLPLTAAVACLCAAGLPSAYANDWTAGVGYWDDAANWNGGVPNNAGGWAIGNIGNNGTAFVTNTVPNVSEAWAGNSGVAGTIIVTNGGTLTVNNWLVVGRTGNGGNTPLSTVIVDGGVINKNGDGFIIGDDGNCQGQLFVKGNGQVNVSGGWNGIGNGSGRGSLYLQDNATYTLVAQDWNIGDYGDGKGHAYIQDNAKLNVSRFFVGKFDNAVGAVWQTGGAVVGKGDNANEWTFGGDNSAAVNAFGFYHLAGGTFTCPYNFQVGRYGKGVFYQSGGTNTQSGWCDTARYTGSLGVTWISGGLFEHIGTGTRYMVGENGRGEVTVSDSGTLTTVMPLVMANGTSFLTLKGGTVQVPQIDKGGGQAYLNLDGGTLKPKYSNPLFMTGNLTEARVYSGHAIFDTVGYDITVSQPLLAPSGQGVQIIPVLDGGSGYMAPPLVQITGDGSGALALAQIDPVAGKVTNIVVTCPGHDYSYAPYVELIGGGASVPAMAGTPTLATQNSGGVIKNGAGTLTLAGANSYSGPSLVNQGTLVLNAAATGAGACSVADGAGLQVVVSAAGNQLALSGLTLGSATTLGFDLGNFGNPLFAPVRVAGALTLNGTVSLHIADALPQLGQFPLIQYASRTGSGQFVLASLPLGVQAHLVTNAANQTIDLLIDAVGLPRWDGQAGGVWDIALTENWTELSTGLSTKYGDGSAVLFDDAALGTTTVNLAAEVRPGSVKVNNTALNYTFVGSGQIGGATGLLKQGPGSLSIANAANTYTGPTVITGGVLAVTNLANAGQPSAIGASTAAATNLVLANATLSYSGPAVAINRGYSIQATNSAIEAQGDLAFGGVTTASIGSGFVKTGPAKLAYTTVGTNELSGGAFPGYNIQAGTVIFDGSAGPQLNHSQNEFWVGASPDVGAALVLTNSTLNIDSWLAVGRGNGSIGNRSSITLYDSSLRSGSFSMGYANGLAGNLATQVLALNGNSAYTNNGDMNLGESGGSSAAVFVNGTSRLYSNGRVHVGWHDVATGAVTVADSAFMGVNAWLSIGHEGGTGSMVVKDNASLWVLWDLNITDVNTGDGSFTLQDNARVTVNSVYVAKGVGSTGAFKQTGGTLTAKDNLFQIGVHGPATYDMSGGVVNVDRNWTAIARYSDSTGVLNLSGGVFNHNATDRRVLVGEDGNGTLNLRGTGAFNDAGEYLTLGAAASGVGTINLDGGSLTTRRLTGGAGYSSFYFNGGLLKAGANAGANFMSGITGAYVKAGGARIDTGTNAIAIAQELLDGGGNGGLTKLGAGTLALMATNSYAGSTLVSAGTLAGNGAIVGPLTVASGAVLAPGYAIGTLSVSNSLTLAAGSSTVMELDKTAGTNDLVQGVTTLNYGGTLVISNVAGVLAVGDTFRLFSAAAYSGSFSSVVAYSPGQTVSLDTSRLGLDGIVKVSAVAATPINISTVVTNGKLTLAWPANYTGWSLQGQTNSLAEGLSTNWFLVPGSTTTNAVTLPIDTANPATFFRLVAP